MKENPQGKSKAEIYAGVLGYKYELLGGGQDLLAEALIDRIMSDKKLLTSFIDGAQRADLENWNQILSDPNPSE